MDLRSENLFRLAGWKIETKTKKTLGPKTAHDPVRSVADVLRQQDKDWQREQAEKAEKAARDLKAATVCFSCSRELPPHRKGCAMLRLGGFVCQDELCRAKAVSLCWMSADKLKDSEFGKRAFEKGR